MTAVSVNARWEFVFDLRIGKDGGKQEASAGNVDGRPAEGIIVAKAITAAEPQRRWWQLVLPFLSVAGATALRWFLHLHGIG